MGCRPTRGFSAGGARKAGSTRRSSHRRQRQRRKRGAQRSAMVPQHYWRPVKSSMCGIAGFVSETDAGRRERVAAPLRQMCDVIRHRGPDDEGMFVGDGAALGMRRLSIIDLAGGHQPIRNEDGIGLGGVQRRDLQLSRAARRARRPRARVLHRYRHRDDRPRLRAMGRGRVLRTCAGCSASRCGIDAAARCSSPATASASSRSTTPSTTARLVRLRDQVACWRAGRRERSLNPAALEHYLSFLYTPADASIFSGIRKLPPGHLLRWDDGQVSVRRYWDLPAEESFTGSMDEAAERLTTVLADAVKSHLVSDVPTWRAAVRRRRLEPRRRADGARVVAADQDVLDWLRRDRRSTSSTRAGAWRSTSPPIITSSSFGPTR